MEKTFYFLILTLSLVALAFSAYATEEEIPYPLRRGLVRSYGDAEKEITKDNYIATQLQIFKYASRTKNQLDEIDLQNIEEKVKKDSLLEQIKMLSHYDLNKDGSITKEELSFEPSEKLKRVCFDVGGGSNGCPPEIPFKKTKMFWDVLYLDLDNNEIIDGYEMQTLLSFYYTRNQGRWNEWRTVKNYLWLKEAQDGNLTSKEVEYLAGKIFDLHDKNQDKIMSYEEIKPYISFNQESTFWADSCISKPETNLGFKCNLR